MSKGPPKARPIPCSRSGRGGARTPGPGKTIGAPRKAPAERTVVKGPYRFPLDIVEALDQQPPGKATAFICAAVRYFRRATSAAMDLEAAIGNCRCGSDFVIINDFGGCPNGCNRDLATISDAESLTIPPDDHRS